MKKKNSLLEISAVGLILFPLVGLQVDIYEKFWTIRTESALKVFGALFVILILFRSFSKIKKSSLYSQFSILTQTVVKKISENKVFHYQKPILVCLLVSSPIFLSAYETTILTTTFLFIMLGLGLNIVVGLAGLLDLGYVAFFAVGAYTYALLNLHFDVGFWTALPIGGLLACIFGILLGFPVLRLKGDYLAIVTLGFGEIIRLFLENWDELTYGPRGIPNIPSPSFPFANLSFQQNHIFLYYIAGTMMLCTIIAVHRVSVSRLGRAWVALREDEVACQAMGINTTYTKLYAFGLGATWAGFAGVFFAAKNGFINPASFTFMQSALILCIVVLGGMGSIKGIVVAAMMIVLIPEYLNFFEEYRMFLFGAIMVLTMLIKPEGLFPHQGKIYELR